MRLLWLEIQEKVDFAFRKMNSKVFSQNALLPSSKLIERKHILKIWWRKQQSRWPKTQGYGKSDNGQKYLYFWHIRLCKFSNTSQHELDVLSSFCCMAANTAGKAEQDRALHIFWVTGRRANKKPDSTVIACSHCSVLAKPHKHWEVEWRRKHLVWWREQEEMDKDSMLVYMYCIYVYLRNRFLVLSTALLLHGQENSTVSHSVGDTIIAA